jgi:hypothetical protein
MTYIDDMFNALPQEQRQKVEAQVMAILESDTELLHRGFDPSNYSHDLVRRTAYEEVINHDMSRLREYWLNK